MEGTPGFHVMIAPPNDCPKKLPPPPFFGVANPEKPCP